MAEKIPLNFYKRVTKSLSRVPTTLYTTPPGRASILLNTFTNNNSNSNNYVTISLSSTSQEDLTYLNRFTLTKKDVINLTPQKVITTEGDSFNASADIEDLVTLSDPATFWEFNLPTDITTLDNITFGFTSGSQISADFGTEGIPNNQRAFNGDFSEWTGWIESFPGSNTTIEYSISADSPVNTGNIAGPDGYVMGLDVGSSDGIVTTPRPTGTVSIKKRTSTLEEQQLLSNVFYPRVNLTNIDPRANEILDPTTTVLISTASWNGVGILLRNTANNPIANATTNPIITELGNELFGRTIKAVTWMRASENTKAVIEVPVVQSQQLTPTGPRYNYGTQNNYTIFNLTTAWTKYETLFTYPTLDEYWLSAFRGDLALGQADRQLSGGYTSFTYLTVDPTLKAVVPLSGYDFGLTVRFRYPYRNTYARRVGDSVASFNHLISTVNSSTILNGYYDIAGLEVFVESGTGFVRLSSFQPVDFTYDLSNETDTNITLSILETDNRPA